jgi:hypothetical protein
VVLRCSLSSGVLIGLRLLQGLASEAIATYYPPPTSNVIDSAEKREPTLIFHSSSKVVSSKATLPWRQGVVGGAVGKTK